MALLALRQALREGVPVLDPLQHTLAPAVGALAAGNRVMIKPSELTPHFAALLKQVIAEKFDAKELLVTGIEDEIAKAFPTLPFDHLIFTGSTRVGRIVAEAAARNLTPVTLELGGKSPQIVFADADLDAAVPAIVNAIVQNAGQTCSAGSRLLCTIPSARRRNSASAASAGEGL